MSQRVHIIAPPPTPNGDLHIGHIAGPYLAADIYRRYLAQRGHETNYVVSSDDHQSYVDTTAVRLRLERTTLVQRSREEISSTLKGYGIGISTFACIDSKYRTFIADFFERLLKDGSIEVRSVDVLFDPQTGAYPVESFVSGICPTCLASAAGGICEACGHPNSCVNLLNLEKDRFEIVNVPRLTIDLERYRTRLQQTLGSMPHRPALKRLITKLLSQELPPFSLSYQTQHGIGASFADLPDQKLNVWGEMCPGHMYFLRQTCGDLSARDGYVQFLGFDNSYFYVIVHMALLFAARKAGFDWPTPIAFITNQFYNLDSDKFSTSKGHLVWARDLASEFNPDLIRLYLALHGPEYQEASFVKSVFEKSVSELAERINRAVRAFNAAGVKFPQDQAAAPTHIIQPMGQTLELEHYSASLIGRTALNGIQRIEQEIASGNESILSYVPSILVLSLEVFCPDYSASLRDLCAIRCCGWNDLEPIVRHTVLPEIQVRA